MATTTAALKQLRKRMPKTYGLATQSGCSIEQTKSNHFTILTPDGAGRFVVAVSANSQRADQQNLSRLRRHLKSVEAAQMGG